MFSESFDESEAWGILSPSHHPSAIALTADDVRLLRLLRHILAEHKAQIVTRVLDGTQDIEGASPAEIREQLWRSVCDSVLHAVLLNADLVVRCAHARVTSLTGILAAFACMQREIQAVLFDRLPAEEVPAALSAVGRSAALVMNEVLQIERDAFADEISRKRDLLQALDAERLVTKSVLQHAPVATARLDRHFVILECNVEFLAAVDNRTRPDVIGKPLFELMPTLPQERFQAVLTEGVPQKELGDQLRISDREVQYWDWACWPVNTEHGKNFGAIFLLVDVTERFIATQQREDFVAMLSHDLKTPLIGANRALELLLDGSLGALNQEQQRLLSGMSQSNDGLYRMIQNLLDVYLLDGGVRKFNFVPHDLSQLARHTIDELLILAKEKEIEITIDDSNYAGLIVCDGEDIARVLVNLIGNSLKFSPPGARIRLLLRTEHGGASVAISDTGRGIDPDEMSNLFARGHSCKRSKYSSTGLGLFISKRIIEAHGGSISCESEVGVGTTFRFNIQVANS